MVAVVIEIIVVIVVRDTFVMDYSAGLCIVAMVRN